MTKHSLDWARLLVASLRSADWKMDDIGAVFGVSGERGTAFASRQPAAVPRVWRFGGPPKAVPPFCRPSDRKTGLEEDTSSLV